MVGIGRIPNNNLNPANDISYQHLPTAHPSQTWLEFKAGTIFFVIVRLRIHLPTLIHFVISFPQASSYPHHSENMLRWSRLQAKQPEVLEGIELPLKSHEANDDLQREVHTEEVLSNDDGRMGIEQDCLLRKSSGFPLAWHLWKAWGLKIIKVQVVWQNHQAALLLRDNPV